MAKYTIVKPTMELLRSTWSVSSCLGVTFLAAHLADHLSFISRVPLDELIAMLHQRAVAGAVTVLQVVDRAAERFDDRLEVRLWPRCQRGPQRLQVRRPFWRCPHQLLEPLLQAFLRDLVVWLDLVGDRERLVEGQIAVAGLIGPGQHSAQLVPLHLVLEFGDRGGGGILGRLALAEEQDCEEDERAIHGFVTPEFNVICGRSI